MFALTHQTENSDEMRKYKCVLVLLMFLFETAVMPLRLNGSVVVYRHELRHLKLMQAQLLNSCQLVLHLAYGFASFYRKTNLIYRIFNNQTYILMETKWKQNLISFYFVKTLAAEYLREQVANIRYNFDFTIMLQNQKE